VAPDLADLRRAGRGSRHFRGLVLVLAGLVNLFSRVDVVVHAIRLVDAFLLNVAFIVLAIVVLVFRFVDAFLIILALNFLDRAGHFTLNLHGNPVRDGRLGRGSGGSGGSGSLSGEQGRQRRQDDDCQELAKHE